MRSVLALTVAAFGAAGLIAQEAQQPTFRGGARFVRVDVYPSDAEGRPIAGLTAGDFELFEDGKPQAIDTFEHVRVEAEPDAIRVDPNTQVEGEVLAKDPRARVFAIVLDTRHVDVASSRAMQKPLTDMLDRIIGPRDLFGVITPQLPPRSFVLGRRSGTVADMMQRHWTWGADDRISPQDEVEDLLDSCFGGLVWNDADSRLNQELVARHRERQTLTFLSEFVDKLASIRDERKSVVIVTQGWRLFSPDEASAELVTARFRGGMPTVSNQQGRIALGTPPQPQGQKDSSDCVSESTALLMMNSDTAYKALMTKAQRANVAFYPVDPRGLSPFDAPLSMGTRSGSVDVGRLKARVEAMQELAENTDGIAFVRNNDLPAQFEKLAGSLSTYYLLGYYSTNTKFDGGYRRLQVKVKRPGVRLTARRGYFAPTEAEIAGLAAGRDAAPAAPSADGAALNTALERLAEVTHGRDVFVQAVRVADGAVIGVELGVAARTSPAWADGGEVRVTVKRASGDLVETRRIEPMRSGVAMRMALAGAEAVRVDVRVRAAGTGPSSAAETSITIPASSTSLLGEAVSYRGLARALAPAADGRYRRTERATIEAVLAPGAVPVGARLLDKTGAPLNIPVVSRERIDAEGTRWMTAELLLAPFTDGDYVVELEALKDDVRQKRLFAIRVVR